MLRSGLAPAATGAADADDAAAGAAAPLVFHACRACCHTAFVCVAAQCESHCGHLEARSSQT